MPDLQFTDAELDALADLLAERVQARLGAGSPWLRAPEAAAYLACPESRIRKLTMTGQLPSHRMGAGCCPARRARRLHPEWGRRIAVKGSAYHLPECAPHRCSGRGATPNRQERFDAREDYP